MDNYNSYDKIVDLYKKMGENDGLLKVFYTNDYPIPYKELTIYPVQVSMYYFFSAFVGCLTQPHRTSGDIKAIQKNYLQYICYLAVEKNKGEFIAQLSELLIMVLRKDYFYTDENGERKPTLDIDLANGVLIIEGKSYDGKDFDKIKKIILEQNYLDVPDETIDPEFVKAYNELQDYKNKHSGFKICDLEDQINILVATSSLKREDVLNMTIRSFSRLLHRIDKIINFKTLSALRPYMDKKEQDKIDHYMVDTEKTLQERYSEALTDIDSFKSKVEGSV